MTDTNVPIELCTICLSTLDNDNETYTLECNHSFHMKCIMKWFRCDNSSGNCPLCNDNPNYPGPSDPSYFHYSHVFMNERIKNLKKIGRKKDSPANLKKELNKLVDQENKRKELVKSRNEFLKQPEIKEYRRLETKAHNNVWKQDTKIYKQKNKILAMCPTIQMI